jgi:hypothetical protein
VKGRALEVDARAYERHRAVQHDVRLVADDVEMKVSRLVHQMAVAKRRLQRGAPGRRRRRRVLQHLERPELDLARGEQAQVLLAGQHHGAAQQLLGLGDGHAPLGVGGFGLFDQRRGDLRVAAKEAPERPQHLRRIGGLKQGPHA